MRQRPDGIAQPDDRDFSLWLKRVLLVGAAIFLVFTLLDALVFPELVSRFLSYRIAIAVVLAAIAAALGRWPGYRTRFLLGQFAIVASAAAIEAMILQTGGHRSPYATGMILLVVCAHATGQGTMAFHFVAACSIYAVYLLPIIATEPITDVRTFSFANAFLAMTIFVLLLLRYLSIRMARARNTERDQVVKALWESEERFQDVVAAAGEFVWETDARAVVTYVSDRVTNITGYGPEHILGKTPFLFCPPDEAARLRAVAREVARNNACITGLEQRIIHRNGGERYLRISGSPVVRDGIMRGYRGTALDITDQKRTDQELDRYRHRLEAEVAKRTDELRSTIARLQEESLKRTAIEEDLKANRVFLSDILNSIRDPIMVLDRNKNILLANKMFEETFLEGESIMFLEKTCYEALYGSAEPCRSCLSDSAQATGRIASRVVPYGGGDRQTWYDVWVYPFATAAGRAIGSVHHLRDITARRNAEDEIARYQTNLRSLAHQLMTTEERERRKIARELHDGLPQKLALSKMLLQTAAGGLAGDPAAAALLERIYVLYDAMTSDIRSLTHQLASPVLYEVGLEPALERMLKSMLDGMELHGDFENWRTGKPLRGQVATVLYAMTRELVMNVIKHAKAGHLKVTIAELSDMIVLSVHDDGTGMPGQEAGGSAAQRNAGGFGLFSIRERLQHLGGRMVIESGPGLGTLVTIEVPAAAGFERTETRETVEA